MTRLLRALGIGLLAIALVANIAPAYAMALASAPAGHANAAQEADHHHGAAQVEHADQGGSAHGDHADCPGHAKDPTGHSGKGDACNKCCGVCITASVMPVVTDSGISLVATRSSFSVLTKALTAHGPPSDPDIPKPLT